MGDAKIFFVAVLIMFVLGPNIISIAIPFFFLIICPFFYGFVITKDAETRTEKFLGVFCFVVSAFWFLGFARSTFS